MFDGVPEQFHQFIASRASSSPLHLPPLSAFTFHGFDPFPNPNPSPPPPPPPPPHQQLHFLHHPSVLLHHKDVEEEEGKHTVNFDVGARADRPILGAADHGPWSNEEVVALLRIGSSMENWFPEFTWEHASRKLAELGFKRSAEQCKQKFEEQTRSFNSNSSGNSIDINVNYSKTSNYRLLVNELEELYDHHLHHNPIPPPPAPPQQQQPHEVPHDDNNDSGDGIVEKSMEEEDEEEEVGRGGEEGERMAGQDNIEEVDSRAMETTRLAKDWKRLVEEEGDDKVVKKRKRQEKFEMFKRFCENVVEKLMAQQEEMHNKLLEDMIRRDREMVEKEEAWKKMEIDRVNKELDHRAQEQSIAHSRQAAIIELLKRFTSPPRECRDDGDNTSPDPNLASRVDTESKSGMASANAGPVDDDWPNPPPPPAIISSSPGSSKTSQNPSASSNNEGSDKGKRWPREEVLALIKLRSSIQGNSEDRDQQQQPQGSIRAPLWERISRGMSELGYKRSAKRCKEKWENINKYFRKTKDSNASKKRSLDSRTCPYFHQLSALYNQGKLAPDVAVPPENHPSSPENRPS